MIRHGRLQRPVTAAFAISTLPVAVVEPSLATLLVPAIGAPPLIEPRLTPAG